MTHQNNIEWGHTEMHRIQTQPYRTHRVLYRYIISFAKQRGSLALDFTVKGATKLWIHLLLSERSYALKSHRSPVGIFGHDIDIAGIENGGHVRSM